MFNGIDVLQTQDYVKISVQTYVERISEKHLNSWMTMTQNLEYLTPLPRRPKMMQDILNADGSMDEKVQEALAKRMGVGYHGGIGKLIYVMIICHPDISYLVVCFRNTAQSPPKFNTMLSATC